MQEIMFGGFTLQAIAMGKQIYTPEFTPFDKAASVTSEAFAQAKGERMVAMGDLQIEGTLIRQTTDFTTNPPVSPAVPNIKVPNSPQCTQIQTFGADTSCHIMNLTKDDLAEDPTLTGKTYFPLVKLEYMNGRRLRDRVNLPTLPANQVLRYDPVAFPSWCGMSASFSVWVEYTGIGGYILFRAASSETVWPSDGWALYSGESI
jgi:hypothetical protein